MGPLRNLGIFLGFKSQSTIKYIEPTTGDLCTARFADSIFSKDHFPALRGRIVPKFECLEIDCNARSMSFGMREACPL
jgi:hypothetical protein